MYEARLSRDVKVADMIENGEWKWPSEWSAVFPSVVNMTVLELCRKKNDTIVWKNKAFGILK